jgi:replicative DNA helicase
VLATADIYVGDSAVLRMPECAAGAALARDRVDLVIVDYLQLIRHRRGDNRVQEISFISRALRNWRVSSTAGDRRVATHRAPELRSPHIRC